MGAFSSDWLSLREPYDASARDADLADRFVAALSERPAGPIIDLGAGTGATTRALSLRLPAEQPWLLVDHDPNLLATLGDRVPQGTKMRTLRCDLAADLETLPFADVAAVTCSALIDLVSATWLTRLVDILVQHKLPFYAALTYDGRTEWHPDLDLDMPVIERFNRHMVTDKGFGPALGPVAAARAAELLASHKFRAFQADTPWICGPADQAMQLHMVAGYKAAADAIAPEHESEHRGWAVDRRAEIESGRSALKIGHIDLLVLPPKA